MIPCNIVSPTVRASGIRGSSIDERRSSGGGLMIWKGMICSRKHNTYPMTFHPQKIFLLANVFGQFGGIQDTDAVSVCWHQWSEANRLRVQCIVFAHLDRDFNHRRGRSLVRFSGIRWSRRAWGRACSWTTVALTNVFAVIERTSGCGVRSSSLDRITCHLISDLVLYHSVNVGDDDGFFRCGDGILCLG